jgi:hypothetical protein
MGGPRPWGALSPDPWRFGSWLRENARQRGLIPLGRMILQALQDIGEPGSSR